MAKSKLRSVLTRTATAFVLIPITIGCIYAGYPFVQLFALVFGAMLSWEWAQMVPNQRGAFFATLYTVVLAVAATLGSWIAYFLTLFGGCVLAWIKARKEYRRNLLVLGVPYISIGIGSIVWLYDFVGYSAVLWLLLVVWGVDIGGYAIGSTVKGPKLAPKISPNKTWSGLLGGVAFAVLASLTYLHFIGVTKHLVMYGILAAVIAVIAQVGDLVESSVKRSLNIKDSSDLIPGHGGVFDRVDGLIFSAPWVYLLFRYNFLMNLFEGFLSKWNY